MRDKEWSSSSWIKHYSPSLKLVVKVVEILHYGHTQRNRATQSSSFAAEKMETCLWTAWNKKCHWNSYSSLQLFQDSDEDRHLCVMTLGLLSRLLHPSQRKLKSMKHIRQRIINFFILTWFALAESPSNKLYNTHTHTFWGTHSKLRAVSRFYIAMTDHSCIHLIYVTWCFDLIYTYAVKWSPQIKKKRKWWPLWDNGFLLFSFVSFFITSFLSSFLFFLSVFLFFSFSPSLLSFFLTKFTISFLPFLPSFLLCVCVCVVGG